MDIPQTELYRFWRDPLTWVQRRCRALKVDVIAVVKEGGVSPDHWRRWLGGYCGPSITKFAGIMKALERREKAAAQKEVD